MEFRKVLALRGPNVWARFPVLEAWVDLGPLKDSPSDELPGFNERLMAWLPTMVEHRCSVGERGGFFERLRRGTYQAHILEHVTLELQTLAGSAMGYGRARENSEDGYYRVAIRYEEESFARDCLETARRLLDAAVYDKPFDVRGEIDRLCKVGDVRLLGPSSRAILAAAEARDIPATRLTTGILVQLGQGCKQRRIKAAETDRTGSIAESIAKDKELTKRLLRAAGVPVPAGRAVESAEDAWRAAQEIGLPVVVKPRDGNHGRGISLNLKTAEQILAAFPFAAQESEDGVLVERFTLGTEHRLLVIGDRLVAASRGEPETITGDGRQTVRQICNELNLDPRRGDFFANELGKLELDPAALMALEHQQLTPESVPAAGRQVLLHYNGDLTTDETDEVHPAVAAQAVLAAKVVGLDVAGIDLIAADIGRPLEAQGGAIVEVNCGPGLLQHVRPKTGNPRPVGEAIVASLFPPGENGRIPILSVTGSSGRTQAARLAAHAWHTAGRLVGLSCGDGIFVANRQVATGNRADWISAHGLLTHPLVEAAVFDVQDRSIFREGLAFDRCNAAIVTNVADQIDLGEPDWDNPDKAAVVQRCIVETLNADGWAILNAEDARVAEMSQVCKGSVLYYALDEAHPVLAAHRAIGGSATFPCDGIIMLAMGENATPLLPISQVAAEPMAALAVAAALWKLGLAEEQLRQGLQSYAG
ncbi:MAG: cyanophycin synthetase [Pirellulales bacterium]